MSLYQYLDSAREQITKTGAMFSDFTPSSENEVQKLLNSSSVADVTQALRSLLTMVADGNDVHRFFGDVVKNVHSSNINTREMASSLLIMYSQHEPELTLLIVNSVKRMLDDLSAVVRMQALHLVSALRVPTIAPIITHFIGESVNDPSPLVRIACCQAIGKCYELDASLSDDMLALLLSTLNAPKQIQSNTYEAYRVAGWGLAILALHWPQRIDLLHQFFRIYIPHIAEFDDFCYVVLGEMLIRYCRHYMQGPEDPDCQLLVNAVRPLLNSINSDVVIQTAAIVHHLGLPSQFGEFRLPERLLSLPRSPLVWCNILALCTSRPLDFKNYKSKIIFSLGPRDLPEIRVLVAKSAHVVGIAINEEYNIHPESVKNAYLSSSEYSHLQACAESWQDDQMGTRIVLQTITSLTSAERAPKVLKWLVSCATNPNNDSIFVSESLMALRVFVQQQQRLSDVSQILAGLAANDKVLPSARATLIWMLSNHCTTQPALCSELLRKSLLTIPNESAEVRLQVLQLSAKLMTAYKNDNSSFDERVPQFFDYAIKVAHYDPEVDIRDRARVFSSLLNNASEDNSMANLLLQAQLPVPKSQEFGNGKLVLNTSSTYFGKKLGIYAGIENWSQEDTSSLRHRDDPSNEADETNVLHSSEYTPASSSSYQVSSIHSNSQSRKKPHIKSMSLEEFLDVPPNQKAESSEEEEEEEEENESEETDEDSSEEEEEVSEEEDSSGVSGEEGSDDK